MCNIIITKPKQFLDFPSRYVNLCTDKYFDKYRKTWDIEKDGKCIELFNAWPERDKQKYYFYYEDYHDKDKDGNSVEYELGASAPWD